MPANLPPQYYETRKKYKLARTVEEKIKVLEKLLSLVPKHKGTEKLQAELKTKIARLRKEGERKAKTGRKDPAYDIPREGAGRVTLIGPPNSGKSKLLQVLTNALPEVAPYPFTTFKPFVGMMPFEDIKIQLVDTPPLSENFVEMRLSNILRNSDLLSGVIDLGEENLLEQIELILKRLGDFKIRTDKKREEGELVKKLLILGNKKDLPGAQEKWRIVEELYRERFPLLSISAFSGEGLEELKRLIYRLLGIIRIYTKAPGEKIEKRDPVILKEGSTVLEAAREIHKDFGKKLKYACLWNSKGRPLRVGKNYLLKDGEVVEFHL